MTIASTVNRNDYVGNGGVSAYAYSFKIFDQAHLLVTVTSNTSPAVNYTLIIGTDYTVSGVGEISGGTVSLVNNSQAWLTAGKLTTNFSLTLRRIVPLTQSTDIRNQSAYYAALHEDEFDTLTMVDQQQEDELSRSLKFPETDGEGNATLPAVIDRASQFLAFDAQGNPIAASAVTGVPVSPFMQTFVDDTTAGAGLTTLGFSAYIQSIIAGASAAATRTLLGFTGPSGTVGATNLAYDSVHGQTIKTTPQSADEFLIGDTAGGALKKMTLASLLSQFISKQNYFINGNFDFWQRGTAFAAIATNTYSADRIKYVKASTTAVHTLSRIADAPTFVQSAFNSAFCFEASVSTADASVAAGDTARIEQRFEGFTWAKLKGQVVTFTFWVKATKTGTHCVYFNNGTDRSYVAEYTINTTATWEFKTITLTLNPTAGTDAFDNTTGLVIGFALISGSTFQTTAGAWQTGLFHTTANAVNDCDTLSNSFRLSQVMLTIGDTPPAQFNRTAGSYNEEFALCERYFEKTYDLAVTPGNGATGGALSAKSSITGAFFVPIRYRARKRTAPTLHTYATASGTIDKVRDITATTDLSASLTDSGETGGSISWSGTDGNTGEFHFTADAEL